MNALLLFHPFISLSLLVIHYIMFCYMVTTNLLVGELWPEKPEILSDILGATEQDQ